MKNKLCTATTIMDALLSLNCYIVRQDLLDFWPIPGNVWFEAVVEAMAVVGIEYPGNNLVWNAENSLLSFSSSVDMDLAEQMLQVMHEVVARYEELSPAGLLVVH
jgi:hypothetical protein